MTAGDLEHIPANNSEGRLAAMYEPDEFLHSSDAEARAFVDSLGTEHGRDRSSPKCD